MDITEIALAQVTEQFLLYLKSLGNASQSDIANFLVVASRLILIKSRAILPSLSLTEEEEEGIEDLKQRLERLSYFRKIARAMEKIVGLGKEAFSRESFSGVEPVFYPPRDINVLKLVKIMDEFLAATAKIIRIEEKTIQPRFSLEESIDEFIVKISSRLEAAFSKLIKENSSKVDIIISFLAMLELVKRRILTVRQENNFEEIILTKI
ncbi:MAG: segregation/condensation protein A [Parcubacteria group bacterium]|nr:segregation/condensation protein A [Parcubacteria group bacterium]